MFANQSLRDILVFLLPGAATLTLLINFLEIGGNSWTLGGDYIDGFKDSFSFVAAAFLVGYLQGQIPLYIFNKAYNKGFLKRLLGTSMGFELSATTLTEEIQERVLSHLNKLGLIPSTATDLRKRKDTFFLSLSYLVQNAPEHSLVQGRRLAAFSLLDTVVWIPIWLVTIITIDQNIPPCYKIHLIIFSAVLYAIFSYGLFCYHRTEWIKNVYIQFASLDIGRIHAQNKS